MHQILLSDGLIESAKKTPEKTAIVDNGKSCTYSYLINKAIRVANVFIENGLKHGDRCVIYLDNTLLSVISVYATLFAGGIFVIVNPQTKKYKLTYILNDCEASFFVSDASLYENFKSIKKNVKSLKNIIYSGCLEDIDSSFLLSFDEVIVRADNSIPESRSIQKDLSALIYTSGSTGEPKGVMHTHLSMNFAIKSLVTYLRLSSSDRILLVLPLAFDYGLYQLLMSVYLGATLVLEKSFSYPAQIFSRMDEASVTVFPAVPTIFTILLAMNKRNQIKFPKVTRVTNTAAALPPAHVKDLKEIFPSALIFNMYGVTECKRVCYLEPEKIHQKPDSVGQAIPGTEVFILDKNHNKVEPGETGILYVKGSHIMQGYWNQPELSKKMLIDSDLFSEILLCTHDQFKMDEDGDLYFIGRSDDIIKTRGEKVSPTEIENTIYGIDGINEVAVIGVYDEVLGEAIKCFVVLDDNSNLTIHDIKKTCINKLENVLVPKYFQVIQQLPKTSTGKINKSKLE